MPHIYVQNLRKFWRTSNSVDLEEVSVSIPKSEPTPVPIAPANEELGELKPQIMHIVQHILKYFNN